MKKLLVLGAAVLAAGVLAVGVGASGGTGEPVAKGFVCGILDGNGNVFTTTNSELWSFESRSVLRCADYGAPAASLTYFTYANTGLSCGMLQFGSTLDWVDKVGRLGHSQLTCYGPAEAPTAASGGAGIG